MTVSTEAEELTSEEAAMEVALHLCGFFDSKREHGGHKTRSICCTVECSGRDYEAHVTDIHMDASGEFLVARGHKLLGDNAFAWKASISNLYFATTDHGTLLSAPGQPLLMLMV